MSVWQGLFGIIVILSAFYLSSYALWLGKKKNWLGAAGVGILTLATIVMPIVANF